MPNSLADKIKNDLTAAMRAKDALRLAVLRMLLSSLKNKKIEAGNTEELADEQTAAVVKSEIKKRRDSITAYEAGGRQDLAEREAAEIKILNEYLPPQMEGAEIEREVKAVIAEMGEASGAGNFGRVMGAVMKKIGSRADGSAVSAIVKKALAG